MKLFEKIQRIVFTLCNDFRYTYYDSLLKNLELSREEMIALQNELIKKLVMHAYYHTKYYRKLFDKEKINPKDIVTKEDLRKIPVLTKSIIRKNINEIKSDDSYGNNLKIETSGGSTGNQVVVYQSPYYKLMVQPRQEYSL